jgi:CRISPR system Cascade subunit CasA
LPLEECDPYIIEICRRIRLVGEDLVARTAGSSMLRLNAKMRHGDLGDPWMPIHRNQGKALTIGSAGLHYKLVQDLLLGSEYAPGAALEMHDDDSWFIAHAIECGQAKTPALHDRFMLIPPRVRLLLQTDQGRERIAARAGQMVGDAAAMSKVLWAALLPLCRESDPKRRSPEISLHRRPYDRGIDQHFFPCLFQSIEGSESEAALDWQRLLHKLAQNVLMDAIQRTSVPEAKKWARVAEAEAAFGRGVHKRFPDLQSVPDSIESLEPEHGTETDFALER